VVGLRRPGKAPFASAEADAWRGAPEEADFNRHQGLRPVSRLRRPGKRSLRRRRPTLGAPAPGEADFNRRQGLRPTVGLRRPKKHAPRRRRPTPGASAPGEADFNRRQGLRPTVGLRRPKKHAPRQRRPTPGAQRLERPISIGAKAFGRWVGLRRPGEDSFASAEADAWRGASWEADFNRRQGLRPVGRPAPTGRRFFCVGGGRRPARSALRGRFQSAFKADAWRGAPLKADFNRHPGGAPDSPFSRPL